MADEVKKFALLIKMVEVKGRPAEVSVRAQNEGIPDAEVVLTVEAWLDKVKQRLKNERMGTLRFDKDEEQS